MAIVLIACRPSTDEDYLNLLQQVRNECPETNDAQVLIDYFCPRCLFSQQPRIDQLDQLQIIMEFSKNVDVYKTYLLMLLCEALYKNNIIGDADKSKLRQAFFNLGNGWGYGDAIDTWDAHAAVLNINREEDFYRFLATES